MRAKGKWSQFRILREDKRLKNCLLDADIFTKETLFTFLAKYRHLLVLPCFGSEFVFVHVLGDDEIEITSPKIKIILKGKETAFDYLSNNVCTGQKYIVQQLFPTASLKKEVTYFIASVQREVEASDWKMVSLIPHERNGAITENNKRFLMELCSQVGACLEKDFPSCHTIDIGIGQNENGELWIVYTEPHFPASKWNQYLLLQKNPDVLPYLPETHLVTPHTYYQYLNRYRQVIFKPCIGQWGRGIFQVTKFNDGFYQVHFQRKKTNFFNAEEMFRFLNGEFFSKKRYLIQQKIPLATINGNPFDLRVIVQRSSKMSPWHLTGKLIKIAGNHYIITNIAKSLISFEEGMGLSSVKERPLRPLNEKIQEICLMVAKELASIYDDLYMLGFDMAVNEKGQLYMIEVNYKPDVFMFYMLEDKTMHETIMEESRKFRRNEERDNL